MSHHLFSPAAGCCLCVAAAGMLFFLVRALYARLGRRERSPWRSCLCDGTVYLGGGGIIHEVGTAPPPPLEGVFWWERRHGQPGGWCWIELKRDSPSLTHLTTVRTCAEPQPRSCQVLYAPGASSVHQRQGSVARSRMRSFFLRLWVGRAREPRASANPPSVSVSRSSATFLAGRTVGVQDSWLVMSRGVRGLPCRPGHADHIVWVAG